jgi:phenylalanyl-tRNA synthetase beta chain
MLIKELAGGEISSDIVDIYPEPIKNASIAVNYNNVNRLIGKTIEPATIKKIFNLLDIIVLSESGSDIIVEVPAYRVDVKQEADVVEEILRIYGYNNVEISSHVNSTLSYPEKPNKEKIVNIISDHLSANGFAEIMCNSLCPSGWYDNNEDFNKDELVILANPLSSDLNSMRQTLLFGGLNSVSWNINRQNLDLKLYEFGHCYFYHKSTDPYPRVKNYTEKTSLDLFISGNTGKHGWNSKTSQTDFFNIKSSVETILSRLGIKPEELTKGESTKKYFSESVTYLFNNKVVAEAGKVSKSYLSKFDIGQDVYWGHVEWDLLFKMIKTHSIQFKELPKYPSVKRDLALLLDRSIKFSQIRDIANRVEKNMLHDINLFDVYESDNLGTNKKSYAVSFLLRDDLKTMEDKNIEKIMNKLIKAFEEELNAQIR